MNTRFLHPPESPIDQNGFTTLMRALGYRSDSSVCYGYVGAGIPTLLLNEAPTFNRRLRWMRYILDEARKIVEDHKQSLTDAVVSTINATILEVSPCDAFIISEIKAVCEAVEINYQPEFYTPWFPKDQQPFTQDYRKTLPLTKPQKMSAEIVNAPIFTGAYTLDNLNHYLSSFKDTVNRCKANVVAALSSATHTMLIKYDELSQVWFFMEVRETPIQTIQSIPEVAEKINFHFSNTQSTVFATQLFGLEESTLMSTVKTWQLHPLWQTIHRKTYEKAQIVDWNDTHWIHVAAQNGDNESLVDLIHVDCSQLFVKTKNNQTPLDLAREEKQVASEYLITSALQANSMFQQDAKSNPSEKLANSLRNRLC